jgi:hypothetical protein
MCENSGQNTHLIIQHGSAQSTIKFVGTIMMRSVLHPRMELAADHFMATEVMKIMNVVELDYSL